MSSRMLWSPMMAPWSVVSKHRGIFIVVRSPVLCSLPLQLCLSSLSRMYQYHLLSRLITHSFSKNASHWTLIVMFYNRPTWPQIRYGTLKLESIEKFKLYFILPGNTRYIRLMRIFCNNRWNVCDNSPSNIISFSISITSTGLWFDLENEDLCLQEFGGLCKTLMLLYHQTGQIKVLILLSQFN